MAFQLLSLIKTKVSPVLTTETQTKSLLSGLLGGSTSGTLTNLITNLTGSITQPSVSSLLNNLLSGSKLSTTNLSTLLTQFSDSNTSSLNIQNLINSLTQSNGGSFSIPQITNLLSGLLGSNTSNLDLKAISQLVSGLIGGNTGNIDIAKITQLVGGLIGGSSNINIGAIAGLVSNLISGSGNIDIDIAQLVGGLIGGSSNIDIGAIAGLIGNLIGGNGDIDIAQITQLVGSLVGGSSNIDIGVITDLVGKLITGNVDFGDIASDLTENLMPILASINPEGSSVDMVQLSQALPTVVGSVTTLVATLTQANQGNIPETISGAIKGINPLLKLLADSGAIDASQAETVDAIYDVLKGVKVIIDTINDPDLSNISASLNNVIEALKPVIALIDSNGELDGLLANADLPDLSGLLGGDFNLDTITDTLGQLVGGTPPTSTNLSDLFQGNSNLGDIDLSNIIPGITDSLLQPLTSSTLPGYDATTLPTSTPSLELEQPIVFG